MGRGNFSGIVEETIPLLHYQTTSSAPTKGTITRVPMTLMNLPVSYISLSEHDTSVNDMHATRCMIVFFFINSHIDDGA
jgi:hypothetical protein